MEALCEAAKKAADDGDSSGGAEVSRALKSLDTQEIEEAASEMEDQHLVNSPKRILIFSKRMSFLDPKDKASSFGAKPPEVNGFVGTITTIVATGVFLVLAYVPQHWLYAIGVVYYPSRYWALAVPAYATVAIVLALAFYIGLNFMSTPPSTSLNTIFDEFSREPSSFVDQVEEDKRPIEPISDIEIHKINHLMFK